MVSSTIKAVIISTGITVIALFLYLPTSLNLSLSESPIFWTSFLSWLKPPYLFVFINVIITVLVASSSSYHEEEEEEEEEEESLYDDYKIIETDHQIEVKNVDLDFPVTSPPLIAVTVVEKSEEEVIEVINGGDETSEQNHESENLAPVEKPVSSGHRKPVKASQKGGKKKKKVMKVAKPKKATTMEDTWKMVTEEGKSTTLTFNHRRSDTLEVDAGEVKERALRKSVTFRDMTNYQRSPTSSPVKMKTEVSPSREELNRRVEAFIKKCKEERLLESMRLDKVVA